MEFVHLSICLSSMSYSNTIFHVMTLSGIRSISMLQFVPLPFLDHENRFSDLVEFVMCSLVSWVHIMFYIPGKPYIKFGIREVTGRL